jgi:hypothetical protein
MLAALMLVLRAIPAGAWAGVSAISSVFGISQIRLIAYVLCAAAVVSALLVVRHHYVKLGYDEAIHKVQVQDSRAVEAAKKVQENTKHCDDSNGYWDVITQNCRLGDAQ